MDEPNFDWQEFENSFLRSGTGLKDRREWCTSQSHPHHPPAPRPNTTNRQSLKDLSKEEISNWQISLINRSATARAALTTAIYTFTAHNQIFNDTHAPDHTSIISNLRNATLAANLMFKPQKEYHDAVKTLRFFVIDLINVLPHYSPVKNKIGPLYNVLMAQSSETENKVGTGLYGMANFNVQNQGQEREGAGRFVDMMKERIEIWEREEKTLVGWARECMDVI
jgi:hypothetical protein